MDFSSIRHDLVTTGMAHVRSLIDPADVIGLADDVTETLRALGWARPGSLEPDRCPGFGDAEFAAGYTQIQRLEAFHRLAWHPRLTGMMSELLGAPVFAHPNRQVRITLPDGPDQSFHTRPHQDFPVYRVAVDVLTAWVPLHACDDQRSSLRVLRGSHRDGYIRPADSGDTRGVYVDVAPDDPRWTRLSCEVGDVVMFHGFTVHAAGPNRTNLLRLSTVYRYQRCDDPLRAELLLPHGSPEVPGWADLTAGWSSTRWVDVPASVPIVSGQGGRPSMRVLRELPVPSSRLLGQVGTQIDDGEP
jgi:Phytanoyl-CoA dioxygenase (PhyH)